MERPVGRILLPSLIAASLGLGGLALALRPAAVDTTASALMVSQAAPSPAETNAAVREESRILARTRPARPARRRLEVIVHRVEEGESLWSIAERYGTDVDSVMASNELTRGSTVLPGDELRVPPVVGLVYSVQPGDSVHALARMFDVPVEEIAAANDLESDGLIAPGQTLVLPGARRPPERAQVASVSRGSGSIGRYIWPAVGPITSSYGPRWGRPHRGLDIAAPNASEVVAARRGVVISSGWKGPYGLTVEIDHGDGVTTLYAHMSKIYVEAGEALQAGETIGLIGSTGESTGPHLHFELRRNGEPIDPIPHLP